MGVRPVRYCCLDYLEARIAWKYCRILTVWGKANFIDCVAMLYHHVAKSYLKTTTELLQCRHFVWSRVIPHRKQSRSTICTVVCLIQPAAAAIDSGLQKSRHDGAHTNAFLDFLAATVIYLAPTPWNPFIKTKTFIKRILEQINLIHWPKSRRK